MTIAAPSGSRLKEVEWPVAGAVGRAVQILGLLQPICLVLPIGISDLCICILRRLPVRFRECILRGLEMFDGAGLESSNLLGTRDCERIGIAEQICSFLSDLVNRFLTVVSFSIRGKTKVHCPND